MWLYTPLCRSFCPSVCLSVSVGPSVTLYFFGASAVLFWGFCGFWPHCSCPNDQVTSNTALALRSVFGIVLSRMLRNFTPCFVSLSVRPSLCLSACLSIHLSVGPSFPILLFWHFWAFWAHCSYPNAPMTFSLTAPAHLHVSRVAMYPALLYFFLLFSCGHETLKEALSIHPSIRPSVCPSVQLSIHPSIRWHISPSVMIELDSVKTRISAPAH